MPGEGPILYDWIRDGNGVYSGATTGMGLTDVGIPIVEGRTPTRQLLKVSSPALCGRSMRR